MAVVIVAIVYQIKMMLTTTTDRPTELSWTGTGAGGLVSTIKSLNSNNNK